MMNVNQMRDYELQRQQRNMTQSQKKSAVSTKEGVVVNTLIKDNFDNLNDTCDSLIISRDAKLPCELDKNKASKDKSILPISGIALTTMASITALSTFVKNSTKVITQTTKGQRLADTPRNIALNEETHQAIYRMVQCPTRKTIIAGTGVLALTTMAFMGKMFIDGFKDVWVKKKEADIQKNLQENLINVETQSFSGKIKIIRNMMSEKAKEFSQLLSPDNYNRVQFDGTHFKGCKKDCKSDNKKLENLKYFAIGAGTIAGIIGLGYASMKNLGKSKGFIEKYIKRTQNEIQEIAKNTKPETKQNDINKLKEGFQSIDATPEYMKKTLEKTGFSQEEKDGIVFDVSKSSVHANSAIGGDGRGKPSFYSHVNDYRAFFYNWLLDPNNKQFRNLFLGITGVTAASYSGKVMGEGIKEVQVKKLNAQTELELQKRLVSTELRNFKAKKDSAIQPLTEEFYTQLHKGKPKQELKSMADNILFEVKNGPPFVYS